MTQSQFEADTAQHLAKVYRLYAESPHVCAVGCGGKVMRPSDVCGNCAELRDRKKALDSKWRDKCPKRYEDARFDAPDVLRNRVSDVHAIEGARTALDSHTAVTFFGPPGAGKSTLACAIAARWIESARWNHGVYVTAFKLATARAEHALGDGEPDAVDSAKRAGLLVLDDLGSEPLTPHSSVVEVIHSRHENDRLTIVTCAIGRRALAERYGGGCARRLLENASIIELKPAGAQ